MMVRVIAVCLLNLIFFNVFSQSSTTVNIIPKPVSLKIKQGSFRLDKNTTLVVKDEGDKDAAAFFNDYLQKFYGFTLNVNDAATGNKISLSTKKFIKAPENDEHYTLNGSARSIAIQGDSYAGTFRGLQSLIQLLPVKKAASLQVPLV